MSDRKRNVFETAQRIDFFKQANPQLAAELPSSAEMFAANALNIGRFERAGLTAVSADGARTSGTRGKTARFMEITSDLRRVAQAAKMIEKKNPNFKNTFTLPRGGLTYQETIERANSFVADAPNAQPDFNRYALTAQFFGDLKTDADEFAEIAHDQADAQRTGVGATADTDSIIEDTLDGAKN